MPEMSNRFVLMPGRAAGNIIALIDFAESLAAEVNSLHLPRIEPPASRKIDCWLGEMRVSAERGRAEDVATYARRIREKITAELGQSGDD